MEKQFMEDFLERWKEYFPNAELPVGYYYTDQVRENDLENSKDEHRCLICNMNRVRQGYSFVYSAKNPGCLGGKRYTGYSPRLRNNFEYFLSCGIPGKMEGERFKKSPELVKEYLKIHPPFTAPAKYLVFKRLDIMEEDEEPLAVIFFATADVLSGLFTLANYAVAEAHGVIAPMGSGCASIINYAYDESKKENPKCILGMFDVSARPCVPANTLTFTIPMKKFREMIADMDESFLITSSWNEVKERM
ncbi:MAG: DUF169 domain-containing protein [Calditrichia bacterium]